MSKQMQKNANQEGLARRVFRRVGLLRSGEDATGRGRSDIEAWMIQRLADELELDPAEIDRLVPVDRYGLDSRTAASLTGDLEDWLGRRIAATALWEHPTVERLAAHLCAGANNDAAPSASVSIA
jgi:acyl carrier protein